MTSRQIYPLENSVKDGDNGTITLSTNSKIEKIEFESDQGDAWAGIVTVTENGVRQLFRYKSELRNLVQI